MEYHHGPEDADLADIAHDRAEKQRKRDYPRGQGPTYNELAGEDSSGPELDDPEGFSLDQHDPGRYLDAPGFGEDEIDDWPDPDHGREDLQHFGAWPPDATDRDEAEHDWGYDKRREDAEHDIDQEEHRLGAVLRQVEQWPHRFAEGRGYTNAELEAAGHGMHHTDDVKIMRGKDTGLYGEDEDHPQDIIGVPNSHGGYDVLRHL